jgi:hypothetical protein
VSSAVRLHDQSIAIGQAAGAAAAVSLARNVAPRAIPYNAALLASVQEALCARTDGAVPSMLWPYADVEPADPAKSILSVMN